MPPVAKGSGDSCKRDVSGCIAVTEKATDSLWKHIVKSSLLQTGRVQSPNMIQWPSRIAAPATLLILHGVKEESHRFINARVGRNSGGYVKAVSNEVQ